MLEIQDQPIHAAGNAYWIIDIAKHARQQGLGTILIGQGGNATVSWPFKKIQKPPILKIWLLKNFWKTMAIFPKRIRKKYLQNKLDRFYLDGNDKFIQDILIQSKIQRTRQLRDIQEARISQFRNATYTFWENLGNTYNVSFRDPTTDARVINFMLSLPGNNYQNVEKHAWFLKKAFTNRLPLEVINNKKFGLQSADIQKRESGAFEKLKNKLNLQLSDNNLPRYLQGSLHRDTGNINSLYRLYLVLLFLKLQHDEKRRKIYQKELV
jgi:hypothetical protein